MNTPASPKKGIVFDLDGTLVDSLSLTFEAFNHAIRTITGKGVSNEEVAQHFGHGEEVMLAEMIGQEKAPVAYAMVKAYFEENKNRLPLFAGVKTLLDQFQTARVPMSIVTGRSWLTTELILRYHGQLERFVTVVADDHVSQPKPSPEGLLLALARMDIRPENALFVGDSTMDIRAARAAGAQGVAALWDHFARRETLEPARPHHWAQSPAAVWEIWRQFSAAHPS